MSLKNFESLIEKDFKLLKSQFAQTDCIVFRHTDGVLVLRTANRRFASFRLLMLSYVILNP